MKKFYLPIFLLLMVGALSLLNAQTTKPITAKKYATFTVPSDPTLDSIGQAHLPYAGDLGVRRVIVADADGDGTQEVLATDYNNGGRVHVMKVVQDSVLEIIWSSPVAESASGSTPRFIQVGDCDGDGKREIIFEQRNFENVDGSSGRIVIYEWNGTDWGSQPSMSITPKMIEGAGGREGLRLHREVLTVYDFDGDGKTEIVPHGDDPRKDVLILGVSGDLFEGLNFASIFIEGGKPGTQKNGGDWGAGGSFWNATPADIDGDGKIEIVNHVWNKYGFWSIDVNGPNSYTYPDANDNADARAKGAYHEYSDNDAVSYFGAQAVDVNGDGRDEIVGTMYKQHHDLSMLAFSEQDTGVYIWNDNSQTENYNVIVPNGTIAALANKTAMSLWPIVKGDLNQDGKDELYTGGSAGLNLVAVQYKGTGDTPADLLNPENYDINVVYNGEGGDVFAKWNIYNGRVTYRTDTLYAGTDSMQIVETPIGFDPNVIDTVKEETPFTSYIFADSVDLDGDGKLEIVLAEQSVYDSININVFNWVDTSGIGQWILDNDNSYKVFNEYRKTIRVLEYTGESTGLQARTYGIISPDDYKLEQNYPNPFNPTTTINFTLPLNKKITLKVYDMLGKEVKTLIDNTTMQKGNHKVIWDGTNNFGSKVASGNYIAKMKFGNFAKSIKMTLLK